MQDQWQEELSCTLRIKSKYCIMQNAEKKVADHLLSDPAACLNRNILEEAAAVGVSEATVMRFCKTLGYSGYRELKLQLAGELGHRNREYTEDLNIRRDEDPDSLPDKVILRMIRGLQDTRSILDREEYRRAVDVLSAADRVDIYGVGGSYAVALDMENKLMKLGLRCRSYADAHMQIMSAAALGQGSVAIGISHSGRTVETVDALKKARASGATAICITGAAGSPLMEAAHIGIVTAGYEISFTSEAMVSRILQLAVVDMIYLGLFLKDFDRNSEKIDVLNQALLHKAY